MFKQARAMADLGGDIAIYCIVYKQIQTLLADYTLIRDRLIECLDDLFFTLEEIFTDRVALKDSQNDPWMQRGFLETQQKHSQVLEAIRRCDKAVAKIDHQMNLIPPEERVTSLQKKMDDFRFAVVQHHHEMMSALGLPPNPRVVHDMGEIDYSTLNALIQEPEKRKWIEDTNQPEEEEEVANVFTVGSVYKAKYLDADGFASFDIEKHQVMQLLRKKLGSQQAKHLRDRLSKDIASRSLINTDFVDFLTDQSAPYVKSLQDSILTFTEGLEAVEKRASRLREQKDLGLKQDESAASIVSKLRSNDDKKTAKLVHRLSRSILKFGHAKTKLLNVCAGKNVFAAYLNFLDATPNWDLSLPSLGDSSMFETGLLDYVTMQLGLRFSLFRPQVLPGDAGAALACVHVSGNRISQKQVSALFSEPLHQLKYVRFVELAAKRDELLSPAAQTAGSAAPGLLDAKALLTSTFGNTGAVVEFPTKPGTIDAVFLDLSLGPEAEAEIKAALDRVRNEYNLDSSLPAFFFLPTEDVEGLPLSSSLKQKIIRYQFRLNLWGLLEKLEPQDVKAAFADLVIRIKAVAGLFRLSQAECAQIAGLGKNALLTLGLLSQDCGGSRAQKVEGLPLRLQSTILDLLRLDRDSTFGHTVRDKLRRLKMAADHLALAARFVNERVDLPLLGIFQAQLDTLAKNVATATPEGVAIHLNRALHTFHWAEYRSQLSGHLQEHNLTRYLAMGILANSPSVTPRLLEVFGVAAGLGGKGPAPGLFLELFDTVGALLEEEAGSNLAAAYDIIYRCDPAFTVQDFTDFLAYRKTVSPTAAKFSGTGISPDFFGAWAQRLSQGRGLPGLGDGQWRFSASPGSATWLPCSESDQQALRFASRQRLETILLENGYKAWLAQQVRAPARNPMLKQPLRWFETSRLTVTPQLLRIGLAELRAHDCLILPTSAGLVPEDDSLKAGYDPKEYLARFGADGVSTTLAVGQSIVVGPLEPCPLAERDIRHLCLAVASPSTLHSARRPVTMSENELKETVVLALQRCEAVPHINSVALFAHFLPLSGMDEFTISRITFTALQAFLPQRPIRVTVLFANGYPKPPKQ